MDAVGELVGRINESERYAFFKQLNCKCLLYYLILGYPNMSTYLLNPDTSLQTFSKRIAGFI